VSPFDDDNSPTKNMTQRIQEKKRKNKEQKLKFLNLQTKFEDPRVSFEYFTKLRRLIFLRQPFMYTIKEHLRSIFVCCFRSKMAEMLRRKQMFDKARVKLYKELDIVTILRSLRKLKMMKKIILKQHQRKLIMLFQQNIIEPDQDDLDQNGKEWRNGLWSFGAVKTIVANSQNNEADRLVLLGLVGQEHYDILVNDKNVLERSR
jgi:hypothetical protein